MKKIFYSYLIILCLFTSSNDAFFRTSWTTIRSSNMKASQSVLNSKKGSVEVFFSSKGYGFIISEEGPEPIFVHHTEIQSEGKRSLIAGEKVEFDAVPDDNRPGKFKAINVTGLHGTRVAGNKFMKQVLLLADKYLENPDGGESLSVSSELVSDKRQKRRRPPISVENSISMKADEEKVVQKKELNTVNDNATPGVQLGIQTKNSSRQNGGISTEPRVALPPRKRAKDGKPLSAAETIFLYGADWDDADTEVKAAKPSQRKLTKPMLPKSPQNSSRQSSRGSSKSSTPSLSAEAAGSVAATLQEPARPIKTGKTGKSAISKTSTSHYSSKVPAAATAAGTPAPPAAAAAAADTSSGKPASAELLVEEEKPFVITPPTPFYKGWTPHMMILGSLYAKI